MKKIILIGLAILSANFIFSQDFTNQIKEQIQKTATTSINSSTINSASQDISAITSNFESNIQLAISNPEYLVTPGDIYSLNYAAGTTPVSYKILVDSSYRIRVSNLAVLDASGKTYVQLKKQVEEIVSKNYPLSGVQFILTSPATFKVIVKGTVENSSEQTAWPLTRLSEILEKSPLNTYSSRRFVKIKSTNGKETTYDLFKTQRFGDYSQDPYIRPGDIITILKTNKKVKISGAIVFPGIYELSESENLKELIESSAGGLSPTADTSRIELNRQISNSIKTGQKFYLSQKDLDENYKLNHMDSIFIETFENLRPRFYIEGAVYNSQEQALQAESSTTIPESSTKFSMQFEQGSYYDFIIRKNEKLFSSVSDIENAYIIRGEEIIPINIQNILDDTNFYSNILINQNDILRIPFKQFFVTVSGSVNNPGRYPYIPDRKYEYYIGLAGGFNKSQNSSKSVKIVSLDGKKLSKTDTITPETTITANTNSFLYYFNQFAPIVTTTLSIITASLSVYAAFK